MNTLLLIDGNSILNRAYYGIRPLTNKDGLHTHAVYGMMNIVLHHIEERKPTHIAVAFDRKAPTFRHQHYDGYKATRKGMPPELAEQLPYAKKCLGAMGITLLELDGFEADDILGTCAFLEKEEPTEVYILTGDRDALQLIRDDVTVLLASTGETKVFDRAAFNEKYGLEPESFVDVKALMGDSSDNIPGVSGIGEKTAIKLIAHYGSLDALYEHPESDGVATGATLKKLLCGKDSAYLSQFLARIKTDVPLGATLPQLVLREKDRTALRDVLCELELMGMIKRLNLDREDEPSDAGESSVDAPASRFETPSYIEKPTAFLNEARPYAAVSLSDTTLYLYDGKESYAVSYTDVSELLPFFSGEENTRVVYDSKALYLTLGDLTCRLFDVSLAAYVLDSSAGSYSLDRLALAYLSEVLPPARNEARVLYELAYLLGEKLKESGQSSLYYHIEEPLAPVLASMERIGFQIDREGLAAFSEELGRRCEEYAEAIYFEAGHAFNINSPKQLGEVLFGELKLPVLKKTKTGYSTDAETLEKLRPYHTIIDRILEYRQVAKLKSTYGDGLLQVADKQGVIHSSFNQTVTATGRLSSSEPNLQNIPIRTALGREMRKFFVPRSPDYCLVDADYSQIELRLLAAIAGDERMIAAFASGEDIHTLTASQVFGVPPEEVTGELRKRAKAVNFGIVYGISAFSLSEDIGVTRAEADRYIKSYYAKYPSIEEYLSSIVEAAKEQGYVTTIFGRRRYIPELSATKKAMQAFGARVAMNSPIQGAAADIIKLAMIAVDRALRERGLDARLILQVHDELILEAHNDCAEEAAKLLKEEMERVVSLPVAMEVEVGVGKNWLECHG